MSLKKLAQSILKSGTVSGTVSGTGCPMMPKNIKPSGTAPDRMVKPKNESVPLSRPYISGTVGQQAKSGTPSGTASGTDETLEHLLQQVGASISEDGRVLRFNPFLAGPEEDPGRWQKALELENIFFQISDFSYHKICCIDFFVYDHQSIKNIDSDILSKMTIYL